METDTVVAIATGLSNAGISILRVSGDRAVKIVDKVFEQKKQGGYLKSAASHTIHYGHIRDNAGEIVDEVLVSIMRAPNSYTREDVVEINCHGGIVVTKKVLEVIIAAGARVAEPGEFTKRAFLNGRIDLSQAEAVIDVIQAKNELALKNSIRQLKGGMKEKISEIRERILLDLAFIEAALDDPEHISLDGFSEVLEQHTREEASQIKKLLETAENGRLLKEGIQTVIIGKPNVGKSSLLNLLLGEDRAIVTEIAGTTRDTLEETLLLNGITLNVVDTAGIRKTDDIVEKIGVDRAREMAGDADLILYIIDSSVPLDENDAEILKLTREKKAIILLNKSDLESAVEEEEIRALTSQKILKISAKEKTGLSQLEEAVEDMFFAGELVKNDEIYITNLRHKAALENAGISLGQVLKSIEAGMPEDFYSIDLMSAYKELGSIIGESVDEDLIDTIFREFCMGK